MMTKDAGWAIARQFAAAEPPEHTRFQAEGHQFSFSKTEWQRLLSKDERSFQSGNERYEDDDDDADSRNTPRQMCRRQFLVLRDYWRDNL